jgi:aspartate racemase
VKDLANAGADFTVLSANTLHIVFDRVAERSPMLLISIIDKTCKYAQSKERKRVVVIDTLFTMKSGMYPKAFDKYGITAVVPSEKEQMKNHNLFFPNLENGILIPEDEQRMLALVYQLIIQHNADALVLGCTELPF